MLLWIFFFRIQGFLYFLCCCFFFSLLFPFSGAVGRGGEGFGRLLLPLKFHQNTKADFGGIIDTGLHVCRSCTGSRHEATRRFVMMSPIRSKTIILPKNLQTAKGLSNVSDSIAGECEVDPRIDATSQTGQQQRNGEEQSC